VKSSTGRQGYGQLVPSESLVISVQQAIDLNSSRPLDPDLAPVLYEIRARFGPSQLIVICADCTQIQVLD
jgi:hypothetical protein